jgi:hypothetical protein
MTPGRLVPATRCRAAPSPPTSNRIGQTGFFSRPSCSRSSRRRKANASQLSQIRSGPAFLSRSLSRLSRGRGCASSLVASYARLHICPPRSSSATLGQAGSLLPYGGADLKGNRPLRFSPVLITNNRPGKEIWLGQLNLIIQ